MQYKNLHIKRLTKKQWQGFILPIGYTTDCHYKTEIKNVGGNFTVSLRMEHFPSPVTHTPDENDFPDRLHAPHWVGACAYGAFDGEKLVGAIEYCPENWTNRMRVTELWTDKNYRKIGLGKYLMNIAKHKATERGCRMVILETQSCNTDAIGFYLHEGFTLAGVLAYDYTNTDMERNEVRLELGWLNPDAK